MASRKKGTKKDNYASSSEDEEQELASRSAPVPKSDGLPQTGPKGVLNDYRRFKEEERKTKAMEEARKRQLINNTVATVKPKSEEIDGADSRDFIDALDQLDMESDPFVQQYLAQRMQQMKEQAKAGKDRRIFGHFTELRGDKYASTIDSAPADVFLVIHIYDEFFDSCITLNHCLTDLAKKFITVKFCRVQVHQLDVSRDFQEKGLPALLVYKGGEMIGNFLKVSDNLGEAFGARHVEAFLRSKNCLPTSDEALILGASPRTSLTSPRPSLTGSPRPSLTGSKAQSDTDDDK